MNTYDATSIRLQLLANGYFPTPNLDKRCMLKGWASQAFVESLTPDTIASWKKSYRGFKATGLLVRDGLMPIDLDISDELMIQDMQDAMLRIMPQAVDIEKAPWRTGRYPKLMVFCRWQISTKYPDKFGRIASAKFIDEAGQSHQIEIFGGAPSHSGGSSKQVGAFGPHSEGIKYSWDDGPSPLTVRLEDLPAVTQEQAWELLAAFEALATARGWRKEEPPHKGAAGKFNYDITPETLFEPEHGSDKVSFYDLEEGTRVSGSFIDGSSARRDKCSVLYCKTRDSLGIFDHESEAWHLPENLKPAGSNEELAERLRGLLGTAPPAPSVPRRPSRPRASASLEAKAMWLLDTQAYSALDFTVVDIFEPGPACQVTPKAFQMLYRSWRDVGNYGPEGGKVTLTATGAWEVSSDRKDVAGVRMRPEQDFPLYEENGALYKNTYLKPAHYNAGGDLAPFTAFLERFLPDPAEREWLLDWMAHKARRPEIPGTAVVFVADDEEDVENGKFGTGRGMLFRMATRLYGVNYTRAQSFGIVSGTSSQGTYNDWIQGSVLVMVDEAKTASPTGHRRGERNSIYEVLKDTVDPAPKRMRVNPKGRQAYDSVSFCSFWIATNHRNAMAIPKDDRRFTVLRNGRPMTVEERNVMEAWLGNDANIGALAAFLDARSLDGFDMFVPLETIGKADMAELALSDVDHVMFELIDDTRKGLVFTKAQMELEVERHLGGRGNHWRGLFDGAWPEHCMALKNEKGGPKRTTVGGIQKKLYCFRKNFTRARGIPMVGLQREAAKWGGIDPISGLAEVLGSRQKDE